jgi:hypothetical protein
MNNDIISFLQGMSNSAAGTVTAPVDGIAWLLRKAGVPVPAAPVGGSDWMEQKGLLAQPKSRNAGLLGEAIGGVAPIVAAAKAPQIARGLLQMGENAAKPSTLRNVSQRGIFGGELAQTADKAALSKAKELEKAGAEQRAIWKETGWFKGGDGKWRFEIDDSGANFFRTTKTATNEELSQFLEANRFLKSMRMEKQALRDAGGFNVSDYYKSRPGSYEKWKEAEKTVSDYKSTFLNPAPKSGTLDQFMEHDTLFRNYPDLANAHTTWRPGEDGGAYLRQLDSLSVGGRKPTSTALHELQHAIQQREGFANGGSPAEMKQIALEMLRRDVSSGAIQDTRQAMEMLPMAQENAYRRLAGEAEARAVQSRMNLTPAQRKALFPLDSYDVPLDSLIYR